MDQGIMIAGLLSLSTLLAFAKGALGLGFVIFVHELGHFLVAKACGVKCDKFYVGFDPPITLLGVQLPRTLFKKQWGETEYGIGIIPLGGYVKMLGQDDNPANSASEAARIKMEGGQLDPRSYPAKSVPQRMAIISAGVVFNLIFGLLFATVAYKLGVKYMPTVIGGTSTGDPAWLAGLEPGDRIVSLHKDQPADERLRFREDLKLTMVALDPGESLDLKLNNVETGQTRDLNVQPNSGFLKQIGTPSIGIFMASAGGIYGVLEDSPAKKAGLKPNDKIIGVEVDGTRVDIDPDVPAIALQRELAKNQHRPITLHIQRPAGDKGGSPTQHQLPIGISHKKRFGIHLEMGPVACIQKGSVAQQAGMLVGDIITQIDAQPVGDPLTLPIRILDHVGKPTEIQVQRGDSSVNLQLTPRAPSMLSQVSRRGGPIGLDTLGIGYVISGKVHDVLPDSPAAEAGLRAGDEIESVQVVLAGDIPAEQRLWGIFGWLQDLMRGGMKQRRLRRALDVYDVNRPMAVSEQDSNWPYVIEFAQKEIDLEIELAYKRAGEVTQIRLAPEVSKSLVDASRGFTLKPFNEVRQATTWSEAFALGRREVWEGMKQVLLVLRKIGSNHQNLGGPILIAAAATAEASEGLPRLLTFLTLLSANLAVLNFLPIPVLDGGHMLFLAYEGIVGKPVNERLQMGLTLAGFCLLMGLMLYVFGLDITRFLG